MHEKFWQAHRLYGTILHVNPTGYSHHNATEKHPQEASCSARPSGGEGGGNCFVSIPFVLA